MSRSIIAVAAALMVTAAAGQTMAQDTSTVDDVARGKAETAQQDAANAQNAASSVAGGLAALEARVAELEALLNPVTAVMVDCTTDTIADALAQASPGVPLTVTIEGTCTENVTIDRDDITLIGAAGGLPDEIVGGVVIDGAQNAIVQSLTIRDGTTSPFTSFAAGVFLTNMASATLQDLSVSGHLGTTGGFPSGVGIWARWNSFVLMEGVDVTAPAGSEEAVLLTDGADARIQNSTLISMESAPFSGAALGLFRSAHARVNGNNTIQNTTVSADARVAIAITVADTSNLRVQSGTNNVIGNVQIESNSQADFRGVSFTGQTWIVSQSGATYSRNPSITGNIFLQEQSTLQAFGNAGEVDVSGNVECADTTSGIADPALSASSVIGCTILAGFPFP